MGSSGSGRISDYPGSSSSGQAGGTGQAGGGNGDAASDRCNKAFSARLEDVEQSEYYSVHRTAPPIDTELRIEQRKRIVAMTTSGQSIGTSLRRLNYLAACMKAGWRYGGTVRSVAGAAPVATISVDFIAIAPK